MSPSPSLRAEWWAREQNIDSIDAVPRAILPSGPARTHLLQLASDGHDVYCYHAGPADAGVWNVWLEHERIPVVEYVAAFGQTGGAA